MEAFDRFDGREWLQSDMVHWNEPGVSPKLETRNAKPWMRYAYYPGGLVRSTDEPIAIKLIGYRSARIVSPSLLTACHIDQVDRPDFFGWTPDGQPEMRHREFIPQLTVLREEYSIPNLHLLRHDASGYAHVSAGERDRSLIESYLQVPEGRDSLRKEALRRAGVAEIGTWRGVEAIVESIRQEGTYSPTNAFQPSATTWWSISSGTAKGPIISSRQLLRCCFEVLMFLVDWSRDSMLDRRTSICALDRQRSSRRLAYVDRGLRQRNVDSGRNDSWI